MMFLSMFFVVFFFMLLMFSLVTNPIYYCGLLVVNSLISGLICYKVFGFSWYPVLLCLVYVGGVYILFVFVSVFSPNSSLVLYYKVNYATMFIICFMVMLIGGFMMYSNMNVEFSEVLCIIAEGSFYVCMCLALVFGFVMLSMVMSIKMNYYR